MQERTMTGLTKVVARDDLVEAEVQRLARHKLIFDVQVVAVWLAIAALVIIFFAFIRFDRPFLFDACAAGAGQTCQLSPRFDAERIPNGTLNLGVIQVSWSGWAPFIIAGIPMTLFLSVASISLAVILALFGALGRLSKNPLFFGPATFYVSLFRGIPLLVQIFMWYLALPQIKIPGLAPDGIIIPSVPAGILALGVCYGAYMTETFRAGIQSISQGQTEAAMALGMNHWQVMRRVILPQALRVVIPPIGNEFITMTKDSSMVYVMSVWELLYRASKVGRQNFRNFETLMLAALFYWIMTITLQFLQSKLEARMARGDR
jgi:polar amino acid transport system permease protein